MRKLIPYYFVSVIVTTAILGFGYLFVTKSGIDPETFRFNTGNWKSSISDLGKEIFPGKSKDVGNQEKYQSKNIPGSSQLSQWFILQSSSPAYIPNFLEPDLGCSWMGVAGQIFDKNNQPVIGMIVEVSGEVDNNKIFSRVPSGEDIKLGPGGYSVKITENPFNSSGNITVLLKDSHGKLKSESIKVSTFADCQKNLVIVNFVEIEIDLWSVFLPAVFH